jgi:hypothetical protein
MDKNSLRESFVKFSNSVDKKYKEALEYEYDYERDPIKEENLNELSRFPDEFAPRFYKCEDIGICRKKWMKGLVSKNKIRLINRDYDLDLM